MTDGLTAPFIMHGAREAIAGGMQHIAEQVEGIERAVDENPGLAFDLAKTLIESACRTILTERNVAFNPGDDVPKLFKAASLNLPFLPASASAEREALPRLTQTLNGLHTAIQGVCEMRNACGFASHGTDSAKPVLQTVQALLVAETADAIVGFLYRVHRQDRTPSPNLRPLYDDNPDFNDYVDNAHGLIRIFEVEFKPSEVLFHMEPETYRVYLAEFEPKPDGNEPSVDVDGTAEVPP